jgi:hypothetical protein
MADWSSRESNTETVTQRASFRLTKLLANEHKSFMISSLSVQAEQNPLAGGTTSMTTATLAGETVTISDEVFSYQKGWNGRQLTVRGYLAFDTETEVLTERHQVPRLALAAVSAGNDANVLIHPDQVGAFILSHPTTRFIFHNCAFDFAVVDRHLTERGEHEARQAWWAACDRNRMSDTMLLDQLIELAKHDTHPRERDLAVLGQLYARLEISKDDPYRLRYGEIIGVDWNEVDEGFFRYAIKDPVVTLRVYHRMILEAQRLIFEFGQGCSDIRKDAIARYGLLTEFIQVKVAIALDRIGRNGTHLDLERIRAAETSLTSSRDAAISNLRSYCPELFKVRTDRSTGQQIPCFTKRGAPSMSDDVLQRQLSRVIDDVRKRSGQVLAIPRTKKDKKLSTSQDIWAEHAHLDPFLAKWLAVKNLSKLCQFFAGLTEPCIRPRYRPLIRTGRTACSGPNLQQVPADGDFRNAFIPSPGHLLLRIDYSAIELRTLAAVCLHRYGKSVLADVIKQGVDPHAYTAALILGLSPKEFGRWKNDDGIMERQLVNGEQEIVTHAQMFKKMRQAAKAINFGVPGGLGASRLVDYARNTFGASMTLEEAETFRDKLINEIYPELSQYLSEDEMAGLARNLGASEQELWAAFDPAATRQGFIVKGIQNVVRGKPLNSEGNPYSPGYLDRVWGTICRLCTRPVLLPDLEARQGSDRLALLLFGRGVATLTGRIRGRVSFTQSRNSPFQGLAADGAKLALWRLMREGYRIVAFVHDEVLIELADEGGFVSETKVQRAKEIMCNEMAQVLGGDLPVDCEASLSVCWSKDASLILQDGKVFPWQPESW